MEAKMSVIYHISFRKSIKHIIIIMKKAFLPPYVKVEKFTQFDVIATSSEVGGEIPGNTIVETGGEDLNPDL